MSLFGLKCALSDENVTELLKCFKLIIVFHFACQSDYFGIGPVSHMFTEYIYIRPI